MRLKLWVGATRLVISVHQNGSNMAPATKRPRRFNQVLGSRLIGQRPSCYQRTRLEARSRLRRAQVRSKIATPRRKIVKYSL
jgi:hypothetical protein